MKFKTVYEGEKALLIKPDGKANVIEGPNRIFICLDKLEKLHEYVANLNEYLVIKYLNGNLVHIRGPTREWFNRLVHESITTEKLLQLNSFQMIVVYSRSDKNNVERRLIQGPCVFMPEPNEWLHEWSWHGQDPTAVGHVLPKLQNFTVLTIQPDFLNYYVKEVRTLDDTLLTIKMMIIFELKDIYTMLDMTQDPVADFINAICADVVSFVGKMTLETFLKESHKLNNLNNHPQLLQRAERIGYEIKSVIYNGYHSSDSLQAIQDNAIQSRTEIRLNGEINAEKQKLIDFKLKSESQRFDLNSQLNSLKNEFSQKLNELNSKHKINIEKIKNDAEIEYKIVEKQIDSELKLKEQEIEHEFLENLKKLGVDVNNYKIELTKSDYKVDVKYRFVQ